MAPTGSPSTRRQRDTASYLSNICRRREGLDIPGSFDLAAVFGDGFDTFRAATGGNFLVEILPMLF